MFLRSKLLIALASGVWFVKQSDAVFQSEDATHGIVDTLLAHLALVDELFQQYAKLHAVWVHRHIDTGIDSNADRIFLVFCHSFAGKEIVDVSPVGDNHSVPVQIFLKPLSKVFVAGVHGYTVDA